ncbi:hypothetical protein A2U01_0065410, partial [Trifolium medium]|nr:hypothetical protein [Trifolium medium]
MSQESPKNNNEVETHTEDTSSQNPRVSESSTDHQEIIVNAVPISMVLPSEGSTKKKTKRITSKKRKNPKK